MYDLVVVIPVYNESEIIGQVISDWSSVLESLRINWNILLINDGSSDLTYSVCLGLTNGNSRITVINKANEGHGPTILQGYKRASTQSEWIFQVDSDNEISATEFPQFWEQRKAADFILGVRKNRTDHPLRKLLSAGSRWTVRLLFGCKLRDVNCPFRLMKASVFKAVYSSIPSYTFAPNVIISGLAQSTHISIREIPVMHHFRTTGTVSIKPNALLRIAKRAFLDCIKFRLFISGKIKHPEKRLVFK